MASIKKTMVISNDEWKDERMMTTVYCNPVEEALYFESHYTGVDTVYTDEIEACVSLDEIISLRDFLNAKIEAISKIYLKNLEGN